MFYKRIKDMRIDNDKTQAQIADYLGMKQSQYARYETGAREFPLRLFVRLAQYYNVSLDYLAGLIDDPRPLR